MFVDTRCVQLQRPILYNLNRDLNLIVCNLAAVIMKHTFQQCIKLIKHIVLRACEWILTCLYGRTRLSGVYIVHSKHMGQVEPPGLLFLVCVFEAGRMAH